MYELSLSSENAKLVNRFCAPTISVGKKQEYDQRAYFGVKVIDDASVTYRGLMQVDELGNLTIPYTVADAAQDISGIYRSGLRVWAATLDGNVYNTGSTYLDTSAIETRKYRSEEAKKLNLVGATLRTEPLPLGGQVVIKYRVNEETSWTTLDTFTTDNDVSHHTTKRANDGDEIQFRFESTGNAVINGFFAKAIEKDKPYG